MILYWWAVQSPSVWTHSCSFSDFKRLCINHTCSGVTSSLWQPVLSGPVLCYIYAYCRNLRMLLKGTSHPGTIAAKIIFHYSHRTNHIFGCLKHHTLMTQHHHFLHNQSLSCDHVGWCMNRNLLVGIKAFLISVPHKFKPRFPGSQSCICLTHRPPQTLLGGRLCWHLENCYYKWF